MYRWFGIWLLKTVFIASLFHAWIYSQEAVVRIDAGDIENRISPYLYGINTARWDESIFPGPPEDMLLSADRDAIAKIRAAGFSVLKYPGGTDADGYIWNDPKNNPAEMSTDEYAQFLKAVGAVGFITVNFNESPELAAAWVRYVNKEKGYGIPFWEVGDEQWGWWARGHDSPQHYAERFISFAQAMKSVDPSIKIAANVKPGAGTDDWTGALLREAGEYIDMVTFTFYPLTSQVNEDDDTLFASIETFHRTYSEIRRSLRENLPAEKADTMWIVPVGYNSVNIYPGPITVSIANALWVGDMLGTMANLGVGMACYWAIHNAYPPRGGDYGVLSSDGKNTPGYSYYPFQIFTELYGNTAVRTSSSDKSLSAYASLKGRDTLSVVLINKSRDGVKQVAFDIRNFIPDASGRAWILNEDRKYAGYREYRISGEKITLEVPPYSLVAIHFYREGRRLPPPNLALNATASASSVSETGPNFGPENTVDGTMYTRWASAPWQSDDGSDTQWLMLDLGDRKYFNEIILHWAHNHAADYRIEVSEDGSNWLVVSKRTNAPGGTERIAIDRSNSRFIRLFCLRGTGSISTYSLFQIEVYNRDGL